MVSELLTTGLLFIGIIGYCLILTYRLKWKFETTPFFTITSIGCILYFASLLNILYYVPVVLLAGGVISFLVFIYLIFFKHKKIEGGLPYLNILIFGTLFFGLFILSRSQQVFIYDEFSHWALAIKELVYLNHLPDLHTSLHAVTYPPITSLIQYFVCRVIGQSEPNYYFAQSLFFLATCMLFTSRSQKRQWFSALGAVAFFIVFAKVMANIGDLATTDVFSLDADAPLAFVFCGIILELMTSKDSNKVTVIRILPALFCLTLIKQIGLLLSLTILLLILARIRIVNDGEGSIIGAVRKYTPALLAFVVLFAAYTSWEIHLKVGNQSQDTVFADQPITIQVNNVNSNRQFETMFEKIARLIRPDKEDKLFFSNLIKKVNIDQNPLGISLVSIFLINLLVFTLQWIYNQEHKSWKIYSTYFSIVVFCSILYLIFLMYVYMFIMTYNDGSRIGSIHRYLYPFLLAVGITNFVFIKQMLDDIQLPVVLPGQVALVLASITLGYALLSFWPLCLAADIESRVVPTQKKQSIMLAKEYRKVIPENSRVFHINVGDNGILHFSLGYEMYPRIFEFWGWNVYQDEDMFVNKKGNLVIPDGAIKIAPQKLSEAVRVGNFDYVWVTYGNTQFWKDYGSLFDKPGTPDGYYLYRVEKEKFVLISSN